MRVCAVVCPAPVLGLATSPAGAQEAEVLRRELEQLTQQLRATQEQDQKVIQDMRDWRQRPKAQPPATPPPTATASAPTVAPGPPVAVQPCTLADLVPEVGPPTRTVRAMRAARGGRSVLFDSRSAPRCTNSSLARRRFATAARPPTITGPPAL